MKKSQTFLSFLFALLIFIISCKNAENKTATQTVSEPSITSSVDTAKHTSVPQEYDVQAMKTSPPDTLFVDVYQNGKIKMGSRNIDFDSLTSNLTDTLRKIKKRTGRFPKVIHSRSNGEVLMGVRGATRDAIKDAKDSVGFDHH